MAQCFVVYLSKENEKINYNKVTYIFPFNSICCTFVDF